MKKLVSLIPVIVLPPIIYTIYAQYYNTDTSSLYRIGFPYLFVLLTVSLFSIVLYTILKRKEQSSVKNNIKFSVVSFTILYVVLWVYGLATREQYRLSYSAFNEAEAMPIHAILFISGLLVNAGFGVLIGLIKRRICRTL